MRAPDQALQQIFTFGARLKRFGSARVLLQCDLDLIEEFLSSKRLMKAGMKITLMPDLASVEGIVKDAPNRGSREQPWFSDQLSLSVRKLIRIPRAEAFVV
jgi:hypothetical protein